MSLTCEDCCDPSVLFDLLTEGGENDCGECQLHLKDQTEHHHHHHHHHLDQDCVLSVLPPEIWWAISNRCIIHDVVSLKESTPYLNHVIPMPKEVCQCLTTSAELPSRGIVEHACRHGLHIDYHRIACCDPFQCNLLQFFRMKTLQYRLENDICSDCAQFVAESPEKGVIKFYLKKLRKIGLASWMFRQDMSLELTFDARIPESAENPSVELQWETHRHGTETVVIGSEDLAKSQGRVKMRMDLSKQFKREVKFLIVIVARGGFNIENPHVCFVKKNDCEECERLKALTN